MTTRILSLLLALMTTAAAQTDFVRPGSIGTPASKTCASTERGAPPITCWLGLRILFLPSSGGNGYGYPLFQNLGC